MKKVAIFASGAGSNAENITKYFANKSRIKITLIGSNKIGAKVFQRLRNHNIPELVFDKNQLEGGQVLKELQIRKIDFLVLAGFLLKIPKSIIKQYKNKIVNIHPSLLPLYGGKGMYGMNVHQAVFESKDKETGITIHFVNEKYDQGAIVFQAKCPIGSNMKPKLIAKKVHKLEMEFFPRIIENILNGQD